MLKKTIQAIATSLTLSLLIPISGLAQNLRIQEIEFSGEVISITLAEGVLTTIELPDYEVIRAVGLGDEQAWAYKTDKNLLALKPKAKNASTNLTIFASERAYLFSIKALNNDEFYVPFWVRVKAPSKVKTEKTKNLVEESKEGSAPQKTKGELIEQEFKLSEYQGRINTNYWAQGSASLQPISAHDNGLQTYLTFSAATPMPAAFIFDEEGNEYSADFHYEGQTLVIHSVTNKILLRRGNTVTGITNASFSPLMKPSATGTLSNRVERNLKRVGP